MLNELLAQKVIVNNTTSCGDSFFIVENSLADKEKDLRENNNRYYNTTETEKQFNRRKQRQYRTTTKAT